jgi:Icc protein
MTTFFHFSDFHILPKKGMTREEGDPCQKIEKLIETAEETGISPSFSIITGDISQNGSQEGYDIAKDYIRKIEQLGGPVLPVIGNVDERENFRKNLLKESYNGKPIPCYYSKTVEDVQVISLDSQNPKKVNGQLQEPQISWLEEELLNKEPTIIALHHPPFTLQLPDGLSYTMFKAKDELMLFKTIKESNTVAILCGHLHQSLITQRNKVSIIVGPAALSESLMNSKVSKTYNASGFTIHTLKENTLISRPVTFSEGRKLIKTTPITQ